MPMSDREQMQVVKDWMKEYGYYILFSVLVFMLANFGWRYWQQHNHAQLERAAMVYSQMLEASGQKKDEEVKLFGEKLIKTYAKSIYASLAALTLAKNYIERKDLKSAKEKLRFVIKRSPSEKIRELARIRMARILIALKEPQKALDLLSSEDDGLYVIEVNEIRGDALLELGKTIEAQKAYRKAEALSRDVDSKPPLLKMKMQQF